MVTQQDEAQALQPEAGGLDDDFKVVDETSDEQKAIEASLDAEGGRVQEDIVDPRDPRPAAEAEPKPEEQSQVQPQPEAGAPEQTPEPETPQPRTFSQEEVAKMQSAWDRQDHAAKERERQLQEQLDERNREVQVEAALRQQEAQLTPTLGSEEARKLARDPGNVAAVTSAVQDAQKAQRLEQELNTVQQQNLQRDQQIVASLLMQDHSLPQEDLPLLMNQNTLEGMQALAARLSTKTNAEQQQEQARLDRVPPETPETQLDGGHHSGSAAETYEARLQRINGMDAADWTDADWKFMETGRMD